MRLRGPRTDEAIAAFLESRRAGGRRPATLRWYRYGLAPLRDRFPRVPGRPAEVEQLLAGLVVAPATRHGHWRALKAFYRWCARRYGVRDVLADIDAPRPSRLLPVALTDDQVDQLLELELSRRDRAIVELLLDTGMRLGELATLDRGAFSAGGVLVSGKSGARVIPVTAETRRLLVGLGDAGCLWTGRRGALTIGGIEDVVERALRRIGVAGGPHLLRHTFATLFLRNGGNVFTLQRILGHAQLSTTRIYVALDVRDLQLQHASCSPIARRRTAAGCGGAVC